MLPTTANEDKSIACAGNKHRASSEIENNEMAEQTRYALALSPHDQHDLPEIVVTAALERTAPTPSTVTIM